MQRALYQNDHQVLHATQGKRLRFTSTN